MKSVEAEGYINAPPEVVWEVLSDADALVGADLGITELEGEIALDRRLRCVP